MAGFTIFGEPLDIFKSNIDVKSTAVGATNYLYQISDGTSYNTTDFSHEFADSGRYIIHQKVSNAFGCSDSITNEVFVFFKYLPYIPNAFSPNQDGKNDHFGLEGIGLLNTELVIYNRWGEVIFKSENGHQKWDGTYKGTPVQPGIYLYSAKVTTYSYQIFFYHGTVQVVY
jgi:gliding motility-associated-like protein